MQQIAKKFGKEACDVIATLREHGVDAESDSATTSRANSQEHPTAAMQPPGSPLPSAPPSDAAGGDISQAFGGSGHPSAASSQVNVALAFGVTDDEIRAKLADSRPGTTLAQAKAAVIAAKQQQQPHQ